ncbi:MAG: hypothetical protein JKY71_05665 [Alphaproteobacteria bacterium]|nr:hypothetical protein [Alphaproteobacteria bacterium]
MTLEPPSVEQDNKPEGQSTILNLYAALGVSIILSVLPLASAALLSLLFFLGVLIAAYVVRGDSEKDGLRENHATYIIRTLWIAAFFSIPTALAATAYMQYHIDNTPFDPCFQDLANRGIGWLERADYMDIYEIVQPCIQTYIDVNTTIFINAAIIGGGPILLYMAYRLARGVSRAIKGYRLANPRALF